MLLWRGRGTCVARAVADDDDASDEADVWADVVADDVRGWADVCADDVEPQAASAITNADNATGGQAAFGAHLRRPRPARSTTCSPESATTVVRLAVSSVIARRLGYTRVSSLVQARPVTETGTNTAASDLVTRSVAR
jgi:hypothetical protein